MSFMFSLPNNPAIAFLTASKKLLYLLILTDAKHCEEDKMTAFKIIQNKLPHVLQQYNNNNSTLVIASGDTLQSASDYASPAAQKNDNKIVVLTPRAQNPQQQRNIIQSQAKERSVTLESFTEQNMEFFVLNILH